MGCGVDGCHCDHYSPYSGPSSIEFLQQSAVPYGDLINGSANEVLVNTKAPETAPRTESSVAKNPPLKGGFFNKSKKAQQIPAQQLLTPPLTPVAATPLVSDKENNNATPDSKKKKQDQEKKANL
ncbi:unnamed protein product, partial [Mesorhabditis spiculigera]